MNLPKLVLDRTPALLFAIVVSSVSIATAQQDTFPQIPDPLQQQAAPPGVLTVEAEPLPIIDPDLTGWNEAGTGRERLGSHLRANWVMISESGSISGSTRAPSVSDVAGMQIYALRDGFVTAQTTADNRGHFQLSGLTAGLYTIVGYSPASFFAFGFNAVDYRMDASYLPRSISTTAITSNNKQLVSRLIEQHSPQVRFRSYGVYSTGEDDITLAQHFGWKGLADFNVEATPATTLQSQAIPLRPGGRFTGRVHQIHNRNGRPVPILDTKLLLIRDGQAVAETSCDNRGVFEFNAVGGGSYGLVAVGGDGFAALGIRLVPPRNLELIPRGTSRRNSTRPEITVKLAKASQAPETGRSADLTLIQPEAIGWINHHVQKQRFAEVMAQPRPVRQQQFCAHCFQPFYGSQPVCGCRR